LGGMLWDGGVSAEGRNKKRKNNRGVEGLRQLYGLFEGSMGRKGGMESERRKERLKKGKGKGSISEKNAGTLLELLGKHRLGQKEMDVRKRQVWELKKKTKITES